MFTFGVQEIIGNGLKHIQEANSHELNPFGLIRAATQNRAAEIKDIGGEEAKMFHLNNLRRKNIFPGAISFIRFPTFLDYS